LDVTRTKKLGNSHGIKILDVPNNIIGGTEVGAGNWLAGNNVDGVWIDGSHALGNVVQGNLIGAGVGGPGNLGNGQSGVKITGEASQNTIGGRSDSAANTIAHNGTNGVTIVSGVSNRIQRNSIYANAGLGIDLGDDGVTPNIAGDTDTGANDLQNFPVVRSAHSATTSITFKLDSLANTTYVVEFFASNQCDASDYGEGKKFLGSTKVTTDGGGTVLAAFSTLTPFASGDAITATATDPNDDTSEFSKCKVAQ
jgi:hypothetical protein